MFGKIFRNSTFQSLVSKLLIVYLVYVKSFSVLRIFSFTANFPEAAMIAGDVAIFTFLMDAFLMYFLRKYIIVTVALKNMKTRENSTIFYRDGRDIDRVVLIVSVKSKSKLILRMFKKIINGGKIIIKLKWSHDTWLSFERVDGKLTMNNKKLFYTVTDGLCIDIFGAISDDETYAEIINTSLLMACDMGDKSEGEITLKEMVTTKKKIKKGILEFLASIWLDFNYVEHKVKII